MSIVQEFIADQEAKMSKMDKFLLYYPKIRKTNSWEPLHNKTDWKKEMVFKPSWLKKMIMLPFLIVLMLFAKSLTSALSNKLLPIVVYVFLLLFVFCFIGLIIWFGFIKPNYFYKIIINNEYIECGEQTFLWKNVEETCILTRGGGKQQNKYLVIFKKDKTVFEFDLYKFILLDWKLATTIEHYKAQHAMQNQL